MSGTVPRLFLSLTMVAVLLGGVVAGKDRPVPKENGPATRIPAAAPEELILAGRHVFERQCAVCHGRWGDGRGEMAAGMVPRPRRLTSGIFKYRSTPVGFLPTDADLERTIRRGVAGTSMPSFSNLQEREVRAVIAYVKTLSSRWRHGTNYADAVTLPAPPPWMDDAVRRAEHAGRGATLFAQLCAPCHGTAGAGDGPAAANLEDVWGQPIRPADLRQPATRSGPEARDLYRTLTTGLDGTPMPSFAESTTGEQRWELVAYVRSLQAGNP